MAYQAKRGVVPRHRWTSLQMANRIPEVELERKIREINRFQAYSKRERQIEERKLWDEMFDNEKILKDSLARFPKREVLNRMILVQKDPEEDKPQPFAEYYRQFIIFKAKRMAKMFGTKGSRLPRYSELYYKEMAPARNNRRNVNKLFKKYQDQLAEDQKKRDILNDDSYQPQQNDDDSLSHFPFEANEATTDFVHGRKNSTKTQVAKRQHRLLQTNESTSQGSGDETDREYFTKSQSEKSYEKVPDSVDEPVFHLPSISDRFKVKSDRVINKGVDCADDGHVSPLPEVRRKTPILDIFKRRRHRKSSGSSSSSSDADD